MNRAVDRESQMDFQLLVESLLGSLRRMRFEVLNSQNISHNLKTV